MTVIKYSSTEDATQYMRIGLMKHGGILPLLRSSNMAQDEFLLSCSHNELFSRSGTALHCTSLYRNANHLDNTNNGDYGKFQIQHQLLSRRRAQACSNVEPLTSRELLRPRPMKLQVD
jgi:hypothetical protein